MSEPLAFITDPPDAVDNPASVFTLPDPDRIVTCFFCADVEQRDWILHELRLAAGRAQAHPDVGSADSAELARQFAVAWSRGEVLNALRTLIHWRVRVLGQGYHTYRLRQGEPPYPWGVILSFRELDTLALMANRQRAYETLKGERMRVMDIFGWGVSGDANGE